MKEDNKKIMINEFEMQIDEIMLLSSKGYDFNQIIELINYQKNCWQLFRFDLQNAGNNFNRINIFDNPDDLHISFPSWFRDSQGQGCQIEGSSKKSYLKFQCVNDGTLKIYLRGVDYRDVKRIRHPIYVNFTTFKINDELIFCEDMLICHNQPYEFEISSVNNDFFEISVEFKTIFDFYPVLLDYFNNVKDMDALNEEYALFKKQVDFLRFLEQVNEINNSSSEVYEFMNDYNELNLSENENLLLFVNFLNHQDNYLNYVTLTNQINQLNSRIEFLENKLDSYENK